eukprot:gene9744-10778_t
MAVTRSKAARSAEAALNRHPMAVEAFKEGVGSVLRQWTALELAVFHQWGGPSSKERADALGDEIVALFTGPDKVYKDDISLVLEDYLDTQFSTVCEDGSPDELGELFVTMWRQCCEGDMSMVTNILAKEYVRHEMVTKSQGLEGGDAIDEDDDDNDEEAGGEGGQEDMVNQLTRQALEGIAEGEEGVMEDDSNAPPLVDPDGFQTVTRGRKSKKAGGKSSSSSYKI